MRLYDDISDEELRSLAGTYHPVGSYYLLCDIYEKRASRESCARWLRQYTTRAARVIDEVLATLSDRERYVIERRYGLTHPVAVEQTLQEIGRERRLTRERIRQIEEKALRRLRHHTRKIRLDGIHVID